MLDLFIFVYLFGPPTNSRPLCGGVYHGAKFGWNRCSNFNNMQFFFSFNDFGLKLKMPIQALKMRVLVDLTP